ncbi:hypothetical protein ElyMa_006655300 [Elysia marginata]|uniref:Uncharacterized protein n=1 Tax=Elysia marginata TaxID=1093978 RepID=A0AAV4IPA4_9GAST|nr:hypothetical protein ElyMa_006655300 [Elysia marginata]
MLHHRPTTQLLRAFNITSRHLSRSVRVARCQPQNRGANTTLTCYIFIASQASQHSSCSSLFLDFCDRAIRCNKAGDWQQGPPSHEMQQGRRLAARPTEP